MMKQEFSKNRVLCIWLPNWPLQRLYAVRRGLKHKGRLKREVVLYEQRRGNRVVACSGKYGIRPGMTLAEASTLAAVQFELHDPQADRTALLKLAAWCEQFSPVIGIEGTDNLVLDVTGLAELFGGEVALAKQVQHSFDRLHLRVQIALADTIAAAWAVAHFGSEIVVSVGTTDGIVDLPIAALRLSDDLVEILSELGIEYIGQLLMLPRDALASRFDPQLLWRLNQVSGLVAEPIISHRPPPEIVVEKLLEYPTDDRQTLDLILNELIERVCQLLVERQQGAIRLECTLQCESYQPDAQTTANCESIINSAAPSLARLVSASPSTAANIKLLVSLFRASAQAKHLLELLKMQLERLTLPGAIAGVKLAVLIATPLESRQQELFDGSNREALRQVGLLVDRLSSRLGQNRVVRAVPQAEAQPELAFRYEPLAGVVDRKRKDNQFKRLPRPLRLEREPIPLEVMSVAPDGPPIQFDWQGLHRIENSWGPERIQTAWWRGRYVQRDYYRVETTVGKRFWLFRRLQDGEWFLHGVFD